MQKNKLFSINIYTLLFNALRLTLLILFLAILFFQLSYYKKEKSQILKAEFPQIPSENKLNINRASAKELEKLPKIGEELAHKIISYREKQGKFRRIEHLILVRGMSDQKFRAIAHLVKAE